MVVKSVKEETFAQDGLGVESHALTRYITKQDTQMLEVVHLRELSEDIMSEDTLGPLEVPSYKLEMTKTTETSISGKEKLEDIKPLRCGIDTTDGTKDGEL